MRTMTARAKPALCVLLAAFLGQEAAAQPDEVTESRVLEEVIVTAQKREQLLDEVPISVFVTTGELIAEQGMWRMSEMADFVPNVVVMEGIGSSIISTRGLATLGLLNPAFEMSTGMFQDGVYMGKTRQSTNHFLDVNRVEVLRGPQPTYFGQGAIAGAISVTSNRPGSKWEGYLRGSYGTDEEANLEFAWGGPLGDLFGLRVALRHYRTDGYFHFTHADRDGPEQDSNSGRVMLEWYPNPAFDARLSLEGFRTDTFGVPGSEQINCDPAGDAFCALVAATPFYDRVEWEQNFRGSQGGGPIQYSHQGPGTGMGPFAGLAGVTLGMLGIVPPGDPAFDELLCPPCGNIIDVSAYPIMSDMGRDTNGRTAALTLNFDFDFATLTSLTAWQYFFNEIGWELDGTAAAGFASHQEDEQDQYSQEFRLTSPGGETLDWMVGLYYQQADFNTFSDWTTAYDGGQYIAVTSPLAPYRHVETVTDDTWKSLFAAVTWNVREAVSIDLGVRYTDVDKKAENIGWSRYLDPDGDPSTPDLGAVIPGSRQRIARPFSDSSTDPSVGVNWQATDQHRIYFRYAEGFKAGGFGVGITIPEDDPATPADEQDAWVYDSEEAESFELGLKSRLLLDRLTLRIALFDTEFTNLQVSAFDPDSVVFLISNAASAHSRGIEVEGEYLATDNLEFRYGLALLDAEYDAFPDAQCSKFEPTTGDACDRSGEDLEYAHDWNLVLGVDYTKPLGARGLDLNLQALASFFDEYALGYGAPNVVQEPYELINLRVALRSPLKGWEVAAYGRNITDQRTVNTVSDSVANGPTEQSFSSNRGASYGLLFSYDF